MRTDCKQWVNPWDGYVYCSTHRQMWHEGKPKPNVACFDDCTVHPCAPKRRNLMSQHEYEVSKHIELQSYPFYALIMAAMRQADTENMHLLKQAFPRTYIELQARYNAPGGVLASDR